MDALPWPRLLASWDGGRLRTLLLHADGRRAHAREEPALDAAQLAPAFADALASLQRPVHHAALISETEMATDEYRRRLGLVTLCSVSRARAQRLAPEDAEGWRGAARALELVLHTPATGAVSDHIRAAYPHLTRSERRVADVVLANPAAALDSATARLAEMARVSEPQVIRFCRALGFDGVKGLKRALAGNLATMSVGSSEVHPLLTHSLRSLHHVDQEQLAAAANVLAQARQVEVFADAARAPLVDLAVHTLWRLGIPAHQVSALARSDGAIGLTLGKPTSCPSGDVMITESHWADCSALQLVTGPEPASAPTLLTMLALQLLLAETGQAVASTPPAKRET